jgi:hypothetical protein
MGWDGPHEVICRRPHLITWLEPQRGRRKMKRHQYLAIIGLLLATSIAAFGSLPSEEKKRSRLQELRSKPQKHLNQFDRAYLDAVSLLESGNSCSDFFGGVSSVQVFDNFAVRLKEGLIADPRMGLVMSGEIINVSNSGSGVSYRLFADAEINTIGSFYKSKVRPEDPLIPNVGSFLPNTREARILILLHELAHLIRGTDGAWLIPDDGGNAELSKQNTRTVESRCGREIRAL